MSAQTPLVQFEWKGPHRSGKVTIFSKVIFLVGLLAIVILTLAGKLDAVSLIELVKHVRS